jgi:MFS family permease
MNSSWAALRHPVFRRLWITSAISGTCIAAHNNAATIIMNAIAGAPVLISLIPVAAALPFFLFALPAGVLADQVNRKTLLCVINLWLATGAFGLAIFGWLHLLSPGLILACIFFIGTGFAFNAPTWTSAIVQIVPETDLPSVASLNGLQFNISGIAGPALGGLLVPLIGANLIFSANAACFLLVILALLQWKQPKRQSKFRLAEPQPGLRAMIHYARRAPRLPVTLARNFEFALFISAIPTVVPMIGLRMLHFNSTNLGLLFTCMGTGSVIAALFILPWVRTRLSGDVLTLSNLFIVLVYFLMGSIHDVPFFLLTTALAGAGWTVSASELWVRSQRTIPNWASGRMNALIITISQGAMVLGGVTWSSLVAINGPTHTLIETAVLFSISILLSTHLPPLFHGPSRPSEAMSASQRA